MKNNNFLIALALCLGLSSTVSFCMDAPPEQAPSSGSWYSPSAWLRSARSTAAGAYRSLGNRAASAFDWIERKKTALKLQNWGYKNLGAIIAILAAAAYKKEDIIALVSTIYDTITPTLTTAGTSIGKGATYVVGKAKEGAGYMGEKAMAGAGYMRGKAVEAVTYAPVRPIPVGATAIAVTAGYKALDTLDKASAAKKEAIKRSSKIEELPLYAAKKTAKEQPVAPYVDPLEEAQREYMAKKARTVKEPDVD